MGDVLVERDPFLAPLLEWVPDADTRSGRLVLLGGEAGVGKSSLIGLLATRVGADVAMRRGFCDNVATPAPLGPVIDALPELADRIEVDDRRDSSTAVPGDPGAVGRPPHRAAPRGRALGGRGDAGADPVPRTPARADAALLAVVTFRDDEVGPGDPLTALLGDLATAPSVDRMHLPLLSADAVAHRCADAGPRLDADALHRRTGGNPFFVTEVAGRRRDGAPARCATRCWPGCRPVARRPGRRWAAAVLGPGASLRLLGEVAGQPAEAVDECVDHGMLVADQGGTGFSFRHEIARETVEASLSAGARTRQHAAALAALIRLGGADDHRLAHHAAGSGQQEDAVRYSIAAAGDSGRLGAHREAAREYRLALRFPEVLDREQTAALYDRLSYECYLTNEPDAALVARRRALELHAQADPASEAVGAAQRWMSRLFWFLGRGAEAERYADLAVATLEPLAAGHELAMALSNKAQLAMLAGRVPETLDWGRRAVELARSIGDRDVESHALNNIGTALLFGSDPLEGIARLHQSLDIAVTDDLHEHAARAYTNLGAGQVRNRALAGADQDLRAGIAYCSERDLDAWRLYMLAWLAVSMLEQGRYAAAAQLAEEVIRNPNTPPVSRIPALVVAGTVALRRGDRGLADERLDEARDLAASTGEVQRIMPVAVARAEAAWSATTSTPPHGSWPSSTRSPATSSSTGSWRRRTGGAGRSGSTSPLGPVSRALRAHGRRRLARGSSGVGADRLPVVAGRLPVARRVRRRRRGGHRAARRDRSRRHPPRADARSPAGRSGDPPRPPRADPSQPRRSHGPRARGARAGRRRPHQRPARRPPLPLREDRRPSRLLGAAQARRAEPGRRGRRRATARAPRPTWGTLPMCAPDPLTFS